MKTTLPELTATSPRFLSLLDSDPDRAWGEFHDFAHRLLAASPPSVFRSLTEEEREDLVSDIVQDCQREDFRLLRLYEDRGRPFAVWLHRMARNRALSALRRPGRQRAAPMPADVVASGDDAERAALRALLLARVQACLATLSDACRVLLVAAAEGRPPREIAHLLGLPPEKNKRIGDRLSQCRRALRQCLEKRR